MRKIGFTQYKNKTKEILPKTYQVNDKQSQRKMFCTMINEFLCKEAQFSLKKALLFENNLLSMFDNKIESFFQINKLKPEKSQKIVRIYAHDSILFNNYFKHSKNLKMKYFAKHTHCKSDFHAFFNYAHPASDLIQLIFNGKEIEMMLDLNEIFTKTIYRRIKQEKNKTVSLDAPYIHIDQDGIRTRLYPRWKHIDPKNLHKRYKDINDGFAQLNNEEIDKCYLVYPKTNNFKRHILVKGESSNQLKMIPYSFTFCNRNKNKRIKQCQK
ncbi:hypothetical protein [Sulfurimonas sp.]|uniref:hypothetical protein n=1 Tax=Sulfurimonas sp. TaxID=2022749 RepID=UPI002B47BBA7|nr:hypothetical protein [Sulfurimonas sp.]